MLIDHYIKWKEEHASEAHAVSNLMVQETHRLFVENIRTLVLDHLAGTEFYERGDSYEEALQRVRYLKHVIENKSIQTHMLTHVMFVKPVYANLS